MFFNNEDVVSFEDLNINEQDTNLLNPIKDYELVKQYSSIKLEINKLERFLSQSTGLFWLKPKASGDKRQLAQSHLDMYRVALSQIVKKLKEDSGDDAQHININIAR